MRRTISLGFWALFALLAAQTLVAFAAPSHAGAQCIDEAIRDELNARRRYRGVEERVFQKALRHELSFMGGYYAADLLSSSYLLQGAYTFHVTEDIALEASFGYTHADSRIVRIIEEDRGTTILRVEAPVYIYAGHLLWTLAYGKMRWFGDGISRFDFYLSLGGGVTDNRTARGLTFSGGFGMKFFLTRWMDFRVDVRDQVLQQDVLGHSTIVNNIAVTGGLSLFIPFGF